MECTNRPALFLDISPQWGELFHPIQFILESQ